VGFPPIADAAAHGSHAAAGDARRTLCISHTPRTSTLPRTAGVQWDATSAEASWIPTDKSSATPASSSPTARYDRPEPSNTIPAARTPLRGAPDRKRMSPGGTT